MPAPSPRDQLAHDVFVACVTISRHARFVESRTLPPHLFNALAWIQSGVTSAGLIAEKERVSPPSMSRTIAGLEERGLVTRQEDPDDGRRLILALTPAGRRTLGQVRAEREQWMREQVDTCSEKEQKTLREAAEILTRMVSE